MTSMAKLTKNELVALISQQQQQMHALQLQVEKLGAQRAAVPPASESIAGVQSTLDDGDVEQLALPEGAHVCTKCGGTGLHASGNDCYQCRGKGYVTARDRRRNDTYDLHRALDVELANAERWLSPSKIPAEVKRGKRLVQHNGWWYIAP